MCKAYSPKSKMATANKIEFMPVLGSHYYSGNTGIYPFSGFHLDISNRNFSMQFGHNIALQGQNGTLIETPLLAKWTGERRKVSPMFFVGTRPCSTSTIPSALAFQSRWRATARSLPTWPPPALRSPSC